MGSDRATGMVVTKSMATVRAREAFVAGGAWLGVCNSRVHGSTAARGFCGQGVVAGIQAARRRPTRLAGPLTIPQAETNTDASASASSAVDPEVELRQMGVDLDDMNAWLDDEDEYDDDGDFVDDFEGDGDSFGTKTKKKRRLGSGDDDRAGEEEEDAEEWMMEKLRFDLVEMWLEEEPKSDIYFREFGKKRRNVVTSMALAGDPDKEPGDPFKYGDYDIYAFWDVDMMNCESLPVHEMIVRVRKVLKQYGVIRDIFGYGNMLVDYKNVESLIESKRVMLRQMMWLDRMPPLGKRMRRLFVDKWGRDYEPSFDIHDVDFDKFFKDDSWNNVMLTKKRLKCEFCNRSNFKKLKSMALHFINVHSYELNDKIQETFPDQPFRKEDWWWNQEARVNQFMIACNAIGLRPGPVGAKQVGYYVATLGLKFNKVRPAKRDTLPQRLQTDVNTTLKRWSAKESARQPLIVLIADERGRLSRTFKEARRRYPGVKVLVVRKQAWKKPYQFADWNYEWDDILRGNYEAIEYER